MRNSVMMNVKFHRDGGTFKVPVNIIDKRENKLKWEQPCIRLNLKMID